MYERNNHEGGFVRLALVPLEYRDNPGTCLRRLCEVDLVRERIVGGLGDGGREVCGTLLLDMTRAVVSNRY